jgi:hypothetical protein
MCFVSWNADSIWGSLGFNFPRRILDFMERIQEYFPQESFQVKKRGSVTGIVKQNSRKYGGNIVVVLLKETFRHRCWLARSCQLCFRIRKKLLLATQNNSHCRNLHSSEWNTGHQDECRRWMIKCVLHLYVKIPVCNSRKAIPATKVSWSE